MLVPKETYACQTYTSPGDALCLGVHRSVFCVLLKSIELCAVAHMITGCDSCHLLSTGETHGQVRA